MPEGDQKIGKKIRPIFWKVAKTDTMPKQLLESSIWKSKTTTSRLFGNLKNSNNKPYFETTYLGENVKQ